MSDDDLESILGNSICQMTQIFEEKKNILFIFLSRNEYRFENFSESNLEREFFASFQEMGRKKKGMEAKW